MIFRSSEYLRKKTTKGTTNAYGYQYNPCGSSCDKNMSFKLYRDPAATQQDYILNKRLIEIRQVGDVSCNGFKKPSDSDSVQCLSNCSVDTKKSYQYYLNRIKPNIHKKFHDKYRQASDIITKKKASWKTSADCSGSTMNYFENVYAEVLSPLPAKTSCN